MAEQPSSEEPLAQEPEPSDLQELLPLLREYGTPVLIGLVGALAVFLCDEIREIDCQVFHTDTGEIFPHVHFSDNRIPSPDAVLRTGFERYAAAKCDPVRCNGLNFGDPD